jgi:pimeloyl-ACP methyl ester carboxylesterase
VSASLAPELITLAGPGGVSLAMDSYNPTARHAILLTHGGGQTRHAWGQTAQMLAERGYRVLSKDMRGHGDSGWDPDGNYVIDVFSADVRASLDWINAPTLLVGASLGGMASLQVAGHQAPAHVRGLVLVDITPKPAPEGVAKIRDFMSAFPDGFDDLEQAAAAVSAYQPHRAARKDNSGLMKNLRERDGRLYWHWDPAFLNMVRTRQDDDHSQQERLASGITVPTLLVRGGESDIVSDANVDDFLKLIPHAKVATVPGARHMVAGDQNTEFGDALIGFVEDVLPP